MFSLHNRFLGAVLAAAALAAAATLSGCHNSSGSDTTGESEASSGSSSVSVSPPASMSDAIATVNGQPVTTAQMYDSMSHYIPNHLPQSDSAMLGEQASWVALQFLIENQVVSQLAQAQGVPATQDEIDARFKDLQLLNEQQATKSFVDSLADEGYTPDLFKAEVIAPEVAKDNLLTQGVTTTPDQVEAYYKANQADFQAPNRVHIERATFVDQATAQAAYTSAVTTGSLAAFASKSTQYPIDFPSFIDLDHPHGLPASLINNLKAAKAGDVLKPTLFGQYWTVIRVVEKRPAATLSFDQVKDMVQSQLLGEKAQQEGKAEALQTAIENAIAKDDIETSRPEFKEVIDQIKRSSSSIAATAAPAPQPPSPAQ